ncbi:MAG: asparagine synthase (glutamine-hydrolyzing) [Deltaproteobacteria bacterium]|nr:asparagine synthase (glutamine-hydrolyzing) [Deltaproteobacteria bacterium]
MCGIVGISKLNGERASVDDIKAMSSVLVHRGPDEAGYALVNGGATGFGHLRLSIIDLVSGQQPLYNDDHSLCLVFNGEIYDYKAIRQSLEKQGHKFRTTSDSEVLLKLYEVHGLDFLEHINGEFAFLIWDQRRRRLVAARDRAGVKPLFYYKTSSEVIFASEAKAILALPRVESSLSTKYLTGPLFGVLPADNSQFTGINCLPPGNLMLIEHGVAGEPMPYWQFDCDIDRSLSQEDAEREVLRLLRKAVERRMVADVDVGVYLSGGLDSTVVCALMAEHGQKVRAFNIGFGGSVYDESSLSRRIAEHYGARFDSLNCSMDAMSENYLATIYHTELALANPSAIAKQMLSRSVREAGVKVCLTGEGADEGFGGYPYFKLEALWGMLMSELPAERRRARKLLKQFEATEYRSRGVLWDSDMPYKRAPWVLGYPSYHQIRAYYSRRYVPLIFNQDRLKLNGSDSPDKIFEHHFANDRVRSLHPFNASRVISMAQLSGYIIPTLGDRVEMAHSVECRTPFLDRDLLNFIARVPPEYFIDIDKLREKRLLRAAVDHLLPDFVRQEHKHPFFSNNWHAFSKTSRGSEIFSDLIGAKNINQTGMFNAGFIKSMMAMWRVAPQSSKFFKRVDIFFGFILGCQALHQQFIANRPVANRNFRMIDRTARAGAETMRPTARGGRNKDRGEPMLEVASVVSIESKLDV